MKFDYVIAGGGSAGCALAARLSEDPKTTVCLIEAGGKGDGIITRAPLGTILTISGRPPINNWAFRTEPQPGLNGRRGYQPRGKTLGGSSAINAMLYVRGHPKDYDEWAKLGCRGWAWKDVLPYFLKSEGNERGKDKLHNDSGPLQVSEQQSPRQISHDFITAANECQIRSNDDFNGPEQEGIGLYQVTQFHDHRKGERCSAAAAYIHPVMDRSNLEVITKARVSNVNFEGKRAVGVTFKKGWKNQTVAARKEVILCGGSFNSPHMLLLSGIGPAEELRAQGIAVRHDLPGVGKNLQDHLDSILSWTTDHDGVVGLNPRGVVNLTKAILQWRRDGTGMAATPAAEVGAFLKTDPKLVRPDIQLHFVIGIVDEHMRKIHFNFGYSCHACVLRPHSRGEVGLNSANPFAPPRIDPKFLSDERDLDALLKGTKMMREIMMAPAMEKYRKKELYTGGLTSDEELRQDIRNRSDTIYHPAGTCKMGTDKMAVVDPQLRVHGIEGLRVVDASVMPKLIGGNTNAPTIMIAEKAADMIKNSARP